MFKMCRHLRIAGLVILISYLFVHNFWLFIIGLNLFAFGYTLSIDKIEKYIEEKEEEKDAISKI